MSASTTRVHALSAGGVSASTTSAAGASAASQCRLKTVSNCAPTVPQALPRGSASVSPPAASTRGCAEASAASPKAARQALPPGRSCATLARVPPPQVPCGAASAAHSTSA